MVGKKVRDVKILTLAIIVYIIFFFSSFFFLKINKTKYTMLV